MNYLYSLQISEAMLFNEQEEQLLKESLTGIATLLVNDIGYTVFTIWAESKENLEKARTLLGKCVMYIYKERIANE